MSVLMGQGPTVLLKINPIWERVRCVVMSGTWMMTSFLFNIITVFIYNHAVGTLNVV